ncbi:DNA topoisomerase I (EC 5.99.1.2) (plasmid) [Mycetohabitans rhizoxinica HKI 454]|uniref:DNA topoisomerase n=1 Tax=Mycetohabitans rhizoxinica (strain DSM 19002 / CIP 109453 / HKI 454) TaxID=882378 RepID=E5AUZ2_MYCRK|nr:MULTISPECIES: DNA topoisomerase IB [Mycetohabitans]MCG1048365.1 DNA topoisomerase IB [Mycetohabitans sp. B6]CBW76916.1 DNA topoisomerase I (EC 5.99.1.2) [Mycetohabitans rhizoxinica HKI 454]
MPGTPAPTATQATPRRRQRPAPDADACEQLRYVSDTQPGYTRRAVNGRFAYFDTRGTRIRDRARIERINALAIPPAYTDVWICPDPYGHLQATGRDARGRKQYRYHAAWRMMRDTHKYARMADFARALPKIRTRVTRDLQRPGMPREKVAAALVRLLDRTLVRIGSPEYARENRSYGLTTLRKQHLALDADRMRLRFRGKSGVEHDVDIDDPRIVRVVRRCMDLPGHELFQYVDECGERHAIGSTDINAYLREISGTGFTAKDYRTWAGSVLALGVLRQIPPCNLTSARRHVVDTVRQVADLLRNTPAVCRKCYIHPVVLEAFETGTLATLEPLRQHRRLKADEALFASLLHHHARTARAGSRRTR